MNNKKCDVATNTSIHESLRILTEPPAVRACAACSDARKNTLPPARVPGVVEKVRGLGILLQRSEGVVYVPVISFVAGRCGRNISRPRLPFLSKRRCGLRPGD